MDTDLLLIRKIKTGDSSASNQFVRKYYPDMLKYCSYHCINRENAQDLTQETFVRFFEKVSEYHHQGKVKNYLYTIVGNLCIDDNRKITGRKEEQAEYLADLGIEDLKMKQTENHIAIGLALQQLPEEFKQVIILYYFQDMKIREISEILHITVPLTKYRLRQAKQKMREVIGEEDIYES